jgi:hypothetical protein
MSNGGLVVPSSMSPRTWKRARWAARAETGLGLAVDDGDQVPIVERSAERAGEHVLELSALVDRARRRRRYCPRTFFTWPIFF